MFVFYFEIETGLKAIFLPTNTTNNNVTNVVQQVRALQSNKQHRPIREQQQIVKIK